MELEVFAQRLIAASDCCKEFTACCVSDELFDSYLYYVELNHFREDETPTLTFPEDRETFPPRVGPMSAQQALPILWRHGRVPEWVDISVWGVRQKITHFKLKCSGRFNDDENEFYYAIETWTNQQLAPFGVKGPPIPSHLALQFLLSKSLGKYRLREACPDFPIR